MAALYKLRALRIGYSQSSCIVVSITQRFLSGDPKPSCFPLQNQLPCRHFTSEISGTQHDFRVNYLINSCGLSPEDAISASKRVKLRSPERADAVLSFLRNHGLSQTQIANVVKNRSEVLQYDPEETLLPKLEFFRSIGVSREDLAITLSYIPQLLTTNLENRIVPTYNFLRSLLSEKNVVSVLKQGPWIFVEGHSKKVAPNIEILRESGMPESCISLLLAHHPSVLMLKPKEIGNVVDEVKQMGFNLQKSTSVLAIYALCGANSKLMWNRCRKVYKRWGWSEDDVLSAFRRHPMCMIVSEKKIMLAMKFLVKMGWPSGMIAKSPVVMCYSLEKRFIPRCLVVKVLLLKGMMEIENVSLGSVLVPSEKCFLERYVARYKGEVPQLLSVYQRKVEVQDV